MIIPNQPIGRAILAVVVALAFGTPHAAADPAGDAAAKAHFERGKTLAASARFADAYQAFEAAFQASSRPAFLFNMGEAARAMPDVVRARAAYERFLAVEPTGTLADTARRRLAELGVPPTPRTARPPVTTRPAITTEPAQEAKPAVTIASPRDVVAHRAEPAPSVTAMEPHPPRGESRPLWKKWPFWAAVGGVVVTAVVVGLVVRSDDATCGAGCIDLR